MPRYFSGGIVPERPEPDHPLFLDVRPSLPDLRVPDHVATDTGLLDRRGERIMRAANPVGFGRDQEW